jgi:hypothetical protein
MFVIGQFIQGLLVLGHKDAKSDTAFTNILIRGG